MPDKLLPLAAEFPAATEAQWRALVAKVLKDKPFETLLSATQNGFAIQPLYAPAHAPRVAMRAGRWQVMQRIDTPDSAAALAEAKDALARGATGVTFVMQGAPAAYGRGLPANTDLAALIAALPADATIEIQPADAETLTRLPARALRIAFDPFATALRNGAKPDAEAAAALAAKRAAQQPGTQTLIADGRIVHDAGGSDAQELAYALAAGVALLRALEAAGLSREAARNVLGFHLAADTDQFLTLAKFRAFRKLWAAIEKACGLSPRAPFVSATTAFRMMLRRDPPSNILRNTVGVVAAALGGADAIAVLPHTIATDSVDEAAHRLARNTQLVVIEEGHIEAVTDPAAGSGGIEALTAQLCTAAWTLFQSIEKQGGLAAAIAAGTLQADIAATCAARKAALAEGRDVFIGLSDAPQAAPGPRLAAASATTITPLPCIRLAESLEA